MDTNNNNKQCECNKPKVINDLLKRISNLEFEVEGKQREIERLNKNIKELEILVECLYLKVTLNQEQEELLNKIILGSDKE